MSARVRIDDAALTIAILGTREGKWWLRLMQRNRRQQEKGEPQPKGRASDLGRNFGRLCRDSFGS